MITRYASVTAPIAGLLLGVLDFVWIKYVPFPLGGLGNSVAVWAVAGFLFTHFARWGWARGIAAATVMLVVAVPSYYLAATVIQNDDVANLYNANAVLWALASWRAQLTSSSSSPPGRTSSSRLPARRRSLPMASRRLAPRMSGR